MFPSRRHLTVGVKYFPCVPILGRITFPVLGSLILADGFVKVLREDKLSYFLSLLPTSNQIDFQTMTDG